MLKYASVLAAAGFAMLPMASQAATPTLGDVLKASGIVANGYVDFGSTLNNAGADKIAGIGGIQGGAGGATEGGFRLNQVGLSIAMTPTTGFGGVLDILAGADAPAIGSDQAGSDVIFKQAYAQYAYGPLTVIGGRFVTLAGTEVINSSQNSNATRGLLFTTLQPLTHTGVRSSYALGKAWTFTLGFNNAAYTATAAGNFPVAATGTSVNDNNHHKTLETQIAFTPFDGFSNAVTFYRGIETASSPGITRAPLLIDLVSSLQVTKAFSMGLNYDHLRSQNIGAIVGGPPTGLNNARVANGLALYGNYQICDNLRLGGRSEYTKSTRSGTVATAPGLPFNTNVNAWEQTLTVGYAPAKNFDLLTDLRYDKETGSNAGATVVGGAPPATPATFVDNNGNGRNAMVSLTVKAIYKF